MNILVIYFDIFIKTITKRFEEYNIKATFVKYPDLDNYLSNNKYPDIIIINGSAKRILHDNNFPTLEKLMKMDIFIIGICFGFQYLAIKTDGILGESVKHLANEKYNNNILLYYNHYDRIYKLSKKWNVIQRHDDFIAIAISKTKKWIGFQFHPEKHKKSFEFFMLPLVTKKFK